MQFCLSGGFAIGAAKRRTVCLVITHIIMAIFAILAALTLLCLSIAYLILDMEVNYTSDYYSYDNDGRYYNEVINIIFFNELLTFCFGNRQFPRRMRSPHLLWFVGQLTRVVAWNKKCNSLIVCKFTFYGIHRTKSIYKFL